MVKYFNAFITTLLSDVCLLFIIIFLHYQIMGYVAWEFIFVVFMVLRYLEELNKEKRKERQLENLYMFLESLDEVLEEANDERK